MLQTKTLPKGFFRKITIFLGGIIITAALIWGLSKTLPEAVDWTSAFRPAARELLKGNSPYLIEGFFNPFWALIPLLPAALFPPAIGRALLFLAAIISLMYTANKLGASPPVMLMLLLSPPAIHGLLNGNIDWLVLLGLVLPPKIGIFLITIKPQIGIAIAIFWTVEAWRKDQWQGLLNLLLPIGSVTLISFLLFGLWPLRSAKEIDLWWNASLWPVSIPVGLALFVSSIRKRDVRYAYGASPCLSPYILLHSWIIALMALLNSVPEFIAAFVGLWILVLIQAF